MYTYICIHILIYLHTHINVYTHTYIHTHTFTLLQYYCLKFVLKKKTTLTTGTTRGPAFSQPKVGGICVHMGLNFPTFPVAGVPNKPSVWNPDSQSSFARLR